MMMSPSQPVCRYVKNDEFVKIENEPQSRGARTVPADGDEK
jgi:hypothetical protein